MKQENERKAQGDNGRYYGEGAASGHVQGTEIAPRAETGGAEGSCLLPGLSETGDTFRCSDALERNGEVGAKLSRG